MRSIEKVFNSTLLAPQFVRGRAAIDDPAAKCDQLMGRLMSPDNLLLCARPAQPLNDGQVGGGCER